VLSSTLVVIKFLKSKKQSRAMDPMSFFKIYRPYGYFSETLWTLWIIGQSREEQKLFLFCLPFTVANQVDATDLLSTRALLFSNTHQFQPEN
jgi:hypothetical protein